MTERPVTLPESMTCTTCNRELVDDNYEADVITPPDVEEMFMVLRCPVCLSKTCITDGGEV